MTERAIKRLVRKLVMVEVACVALFLMGSCAAYSHRGYLAMGGEFVFLVIPLFVTWFECMKEED